MVMMACFFLLFISFDFLIFYIAPRDILVSPHVNNLVAVHETHNSMCIMSIMITIVFLLNRGDYDFDRSTHRHTIFI